MADHVTCQSNIKSNSKDYSKFSYFLGGVDVTQQNLDQFDPYIKGISRIFMHTVPGFMDKLYHKKTENFKSLIETGYTRIDGVQDITVDFEEFEGGFNGDKFNNVSMAHDDTDSLTIDVYEQSGSPVREYLDTWVTGTRDIRTGVAHYHGAIVKNKFKYGEKYHTAEFIYIVMDPTAQDIEYACMFAHCFPTKVPKDHLNYEKGDRGNAPLSLEFKAKKYESPQINTVGQWYLDASRIEYNYLAFDPGIKRDHITSREYCSGNTVKM